MKASRSFGRDFPRGGYLLLLWVLASLSACIKPAVVPPVETETHPEARQDTLKNAPDLELLSLPEAEIAWEDTLWLHSREVTPADIQAPQATLSGFRVQLLDTPDLQEAQAAFEQATLLFSEEGVYYTFDPPRYLLRVGNCRERTAAEKLLRRARALGFASAWVVRDRIVAGYTPPPMPENTAPEGESETP